MSGVERFKRLMSYVKPYRIRFLAAFACSALVALLSGAYAWLAKPVLDDIFIQKNEQMLLVLPLALLGIATLKAVFSYGVGYYGLCRQSGRGGHPAGIVPTADTAVCR